MGACGKDCIQPLPAFPSSPPSPALSLPILPLRGGYGWGEDGCLEGRERRYIKIMGIKYKTLTNKSTISRLGPTLILPPPPGPPLLTHTIQVGKGWVGECKF